MKHILRTAALLLPVLTGTPAAAAAEPSQQLGTKPVKLVLGSRHRLTVDGTPTPLDGLTAALDRLTGADRTRPILLSAPPSTPYGDVAEVMSRLDQGGYKQVMVAAPAPPSRR